MQFFSLTQKLRREGEIRKAGQITQKRSPWEVDIAKKFFFKEEISRNIALQEMLGGGEFRRERIFCDTSNIIS